MEKNTKANRGTLKTQTFRGLHYDLARGNYYSLYSLRRLISFIADCGLNELVFYMEDLWRYRRHPQLSNPHAYDLEDMGSLAEYAKKKGVDLIPSLTTLGHAFYILDKPKYKHLAFVQGKNADLDVFNPAVYELFEDMFDEVLPCFNSPYVHINGDEVNYTHLNKRAKEKARLHGLGYLYGYGMSKIAQMVIARGRRPIMFCDILLHHPESIPFIPKETIVDYWYYDFQPEFPAIEFFCQQGFDVIALPGLLAPDYIIPNYGRVLSNIWGQCRTAVENEKEKGKSLGVCLGTMLSVWEKVAWEDAVLAIYATSQWTKNSNITIDKILGGFARDVFGINRPGLGHNYFLASLEGERLLLLKNAYSRVDWDNREHVLLKGMIGKACRKLKRIACEFEKEGVGVNKDLYRHSVNVIHKTMEYKHKNSPVESELNQPLYSVSLVDPKNLSCRMEKFRTRYGHDLIILTNGLIALVILPEFCGTIIEWTLLSKEPWSAVVSWYERWAGMNELVVGDPGFGSPWAACGIGGWRETIFYNSRLNPCSLWGRPFSVDIINKNGSELIVEFNGKNEVAEVKRRIRIVQGGTRFEIDSEATNIIGPSYLAIQPNSIHALPKTSTLLLRLVEGNGKDTKPRLLTDHDGTKIFAPHGNVIRVESPITGHYLQLQLNRDEVPYCLTDMITEWFTLEPLGKVRFCKKGESVRLRLTYEIGKGNNVCQ